MAAALGWEWRRRMSKIMIWALWPGSGRRARGVRAIGGGAGGRPPTQHPGQDNDHVRELAC
jgi:hypothetical protein